MVVRGTRRAPRSPPVSRHTDKCPGCGFCVEVSNEDLQRIAAEHRDRCPMRDRVRTAGSEGGA